MQDIGEASSYQFQPQAQPVITASQADTLMSKRHDASNLPRRSNSRRREIAEINTDDDHVLDDSPNALSPPHIEETLSGNN